MIKTIRKALLFAKVMYFNSDSNVVDVDWTKTKEIEVLKRLGK